MLQEPRENVVTPRTPVYPYDRQHRKGHEMEIWGLCGSCDRWFYCPDWFNREAPAPTCPVCCVEPMAIENRASGNGVIDVADHGHRHVGVAGDR